MAREFLMARRLDDGEWPDRSGNSGSDAEASRWATLAITELPHCSDWLLEDLRSMEGAYGTLIDRILESLPRGCGRSPQTDHF